MDALDELLAERDDDRRWDLVADLVRRSPADALGVALAGLADEAVHRRAIAADIAGQVTTVDRSLAPTISGPLQERLGQETDAGVLNSIIVALGHACDPTAREAVLPFAAHPDAGVRFAVAFALSGLGLDDQALGVLRTLSSDTDDDVRDWATFALAECAVDDPATVAALAARAEDPDADTRAEGIFGLARRRDPRARALIEREIARGDHGSLIERARDLLDEDVQT